ncbi:MAG: dockerin type I domain-containing protein [Candidatus Bipolaricaulis sp.]|nr:dockerin type I domain-containing protein [Candidatus Bipolaricaulis sp.]
MRKLLWIPILLVSFSGVGLEVNLLEVDLAVAPGQAYTFSFIARNETEAPETFSVYAGDWDRNEMGENRFYPPGTLPRSLCPWLTVTPGSFTLGPGETREIVGTLYVPTSAAPGTHWGIVFVHGEPRPVEHQGTTVMVAKRIGIKVYATVGSAPAEGEVRGVEFRGLNPLWLGVEFTNAGLTNLREVRVEVQIYDAMGERLAEVEPAPVPCLPGASRWVIVETNLRPTPGTYLVVARVDIGGEEILAAQAYLRVRPLSLVPLSGSALPADLDRDGLYEDVDGDGAFTEEDIALFRTHVTSAPVQGNARAFDFNNDGRVDEADVEALTALLAAAPHREPMP